MCPDVAPATKCTECGYAIPPPEVLRTKVDLVRCPKCGKEFAPQPKGE